MFKTLVSSTLIVLGFLVAAPSQAAEWGSLKGRFVVDGKPGAPPPLVVDKDAYCMGKKPTNQAILVGKDNGLENVVVYLRAPRRGEVPLAPSYKDQLAKPVVLDNNGCSFHPHITLIQVGQTLQITNSDPTGHNTNVTAFSFNQTIPAMGKAEVKASKEGPLPTPVVCNIHPFMKGHLLSLKHPYMASSGNDGSFEIKDMPVGTHEIQLWHEAPGYMKGLETKSGKANAQGRINVKIEAGKTTDLGDIKVPASMLKVK
jgi:plastocyanin